MALTTHGLKELKKLNESGLTMTHPYIKSKTSLMKVYLLVIGTYFFI